MSKKYTANVSKNHQNSNIYRRKNSGKCSIITQIQQQMPENLPQMFQKPANPATNAGNFPANVPVALHQCSADVEYLLISEL